MTKISINMGAYINLFLWLAAITILVIITAILYDTFANGLPQLSWSFIVDAPENAGRTGGIGPIIVSTALVLMICLATAIPIGVGAAIYLTEFSNLSTRVTKLVHTSLDILSSTPSIVFGLFGNVFFCKILGLGFSILSGGLTLACMVLPMIVRTSEVGFRGISKEIRLATESLGISKYSAIMKLYLPIASPAIAAGIILSIGRAIAESAALMFTSGYVTRMPSSLHDSGRTLAVHIYDLSMNIPGGDKNAYGTSLVLVLLLLLINGAVAIIVKRIGPKERGYL